MMKYLQLNQELAINRESGKKHQESANEKLARKFKENPLIPIGNKGGKFLKSNFRISRLSSYHWFSCEWFV